MQLLYSQADAVKLYFCVIVIFQKRREEAKTLLRDQASVERLNLNYTCHTSI